MDRRTFNKILGTGAIIAIAPSSITQTLFAADGTLYKSYERSQLVDKNGNPIKAADLKPEIPYVFTYPYVSTPCFLIRLPESAQKEVKLKDVNDEEYTWKGGVGKDGSIVGYSAICSHSLTHPNKSDSFITYVPKGGKTMAYEKGGVIVCSSHLSAFDPKVGAKNVAGPADEPLPAIVLEYDEKTDFIYAAGVLGPARFHDFFKTFKPQLKKQFKKYKKAKKFVKFSIATIPLTEYSEDVILY